MVFTKKRLILGVLAVLLLVFFYRLFAVYTVRSGECRPRPVDPTLRLLTRTENGTLVSFPERVGFPPQRRPLIVMTYNIAGHDELIDDDHVRDIAEAIQRLHPDIVALQEVHRKTWQARFHDQLAEARGAHRPPRLLRPKLRPVGRGIRQRHPHPRPDRARKSASLALYRRAEGASRGDDPD